MSENEIRLTIKDEMKNRISLALKDPILQQSFEIICKELAELRADNDARKFAMAMSEKVEKQLREENAELKKSVNNWLKYEKETQYHKSIIKDLKKENAELKEKIRLMNEQEARDITSRFPC